MDAANIDIKAFNDDFYKKITGVPYLKPVLETAIYWKEHGMHIEITNLIIPEENDNLNEIERLCSWIFQNLGDKTPVHFSAYHPDYKLKNHNRTSAKTLINAYSIAKRVGLNYIYIGNANLSEGNNTYCPNCGNILIKRSGYTLSNYNITDDNLCKKCKKKTEIIGKGKIRKSYY